jgi:drug/metabolite transporter (DMT)-like permease
MSAATGEGPSAMDDIDRRQAELPPVKTLATVSLALIVVGGIYMAAHIDHAATLVPATVLAVAAALVMVVNAVLLVRIRSFAWDTFLTVFGWALLAYLVIAGILEFVFVYDHTPGRQLALFSVMLALFAVDVPMLLAFSVARYQPVPD